MINEYNAARESEGHTNKDSWQAAKDHGFRAIVSCGLMDEENEIAVPVRQGISPTR